MPSSPQPARTRILISFGCIYFFWGSTFVATRYGVEVLPPFVIASSRFLIAASIALGLCLIFKVPMRPTKRELGLLALIGILMLTTGTPGIIWSEQYISSGLASLLAASIPLYAALIETVLPNDGVLPPRGWVGIAIGFCGLAFLLWPSLRSSLHGDSRQLIASGAALIGLSVGRAPRSSHAASSSASAAWLPPAGRCSSAAFAICASSL